MRSEEEIINALAVLKEVCLDHFLNDGCRCCPLRDYRTLGCGLVHCVPADFEFIETKEETPRAILLQEET